MEKRTRLPKTGKYSKKNVDALIKTQVEIQKNAEYWQNQAGFWQTRFQTTEQILLKRTEELKAKFINERGQLLNSLGQITESISKAIVYVVGKEQL